MSGSVERWLGTFMCKQYAYLFEEYGFKTLQQVCQLQRPTLQSMGIPPDQCEKILENVNVLRQSLLASSPEHMGSHDASFPPPNYGMRHNMHSPHYPGSSGPGCTYQEQHPYENQMANHNQSNNYNYHPPSPYPPVSPSPQQYSGQMNSTTGPYSNSQAYTGSQGTQYTNQEVYGQQLGYNSRIHQPQVSWDINPSHELRTYNQSPRTVIGSSPPPSVMRSPPPGPGMTMSHYRQMMMNNLAEQSPHGWSQSQIPSPGMMHSPRTTPSPGMGHAAGNLTSPGLPNRSPAHKPFSPPPFSSHGPPPPAHQQQSMNNYDYPGTHPVSPAGMTPNRSMPSPSNQNPPARNNTDPLQSLQKMVLLEGQAMVPTYPSPGVDQQSASLQKPGSSFGIDQLVAKEANSMVHSSSPSSLSSTSSVSQPQKFAKPENEAVNSVSSRDSEHAETKEEPKENLSHQTTDDTAQSTSSPQITPSSASSPLNKELPSSEVNNASQSSVTMSMPMNKSASSIPDLKQNVMENRTDGRSVLTASTNHSNGSLTIMQPPRNRWKNSPVVNNDDLVELSSREKYFQLPEQNSNDGNNLINLDVPVPNGQVSDSMHHDEAESGDLYVMKNQKYRKMVDAQPHFMRQEDMPNNSYIMRNDSNADYRDMQQQHDFQNSIAPPVRKPRFSRKLRGKKAAMAGRLENHHVDAYPYPNNVGSMDGEQVPHYYKNQMDGVMMKKCRGPVIHMGSTPHAYVDANSMPDMDVNYMQMRPPYKKPPYLMQRAPPYNLSMSDSEMPPHISDPVNASKPLAFSPVRTHTSQVPSQLIPLGNSLPSVTLTDCSKQIKEELKVNSYVSAESMSNNRLSESSRLSSDEHYRLNCSSGTDTSAGDGSLSPKKRRGRPPGSKNKPKPPGFDKDKKTKKKPLESPEPLPEKPAKKRKVEENKKPDVPINVKLRGPFVHVDCSNNHPTKVKIINTSCRDEETDCKGFKKKKVHNREGGNVISSGFTKRKLAKIGYTSTLSAKYDAVTKDTTWICALCHQGSHYQGLGDLFGPYFENRPPIESSAMDKSTTSNPQPVETGATTSELPVRKVRAKRKRSELVEEFLKSTMAKKCKRSKEAAAGKEPAEPVEKTETAVQPPVPDGPKEIWVHEDCIVWSHGVYLVGNKICGLQEAARVSADMVCCKCKETGATLGCFNKGCTEQYHYICAIERGCHLDEANYSTLCPKHKKRTRLVT